MSTRMIENGSPWSRLQWISCQRSLALWVKSGKPKPYRHLRGARGLSVPEEIKENVDILGRGSEEEIKARNLWYLMCYPDLFGQMCEHFRKQA